MTTDDRLLEERLTRALTQPISLDRQSALDRRVGKAIQRQTSRRARPAVSRTVLLVAALMLALPAVVGAGAVFLDTEAPYGMGNAEQFDAELEEARAVTPIPPGASWPAYLDRAEDRSASYGTGLGWSMVQINAYCMWLGYWYQAQESGDTQAVESALAALGRARRWDTLTDERTSDQAFRDNIQHTIGAAERGDAEAVLTELELNCQGVWAPPAIK